jgi:hypothetical protein
MKTFNQTKSFSPSSTGVRSGKQANQKRRDSPYATLLQAPMSSMACNVSDRSDIKAVAILGYN